MRGRWWLAVLAATLLPAEAAAQFSTDFPGIPRASLSRLGGSQGRFLSEFQYHKLPGAEGDTVSVGVRLGFGRSWRVATNFELGYDLSIVQARMLRVPATGGTSPALSDRNSHFLGTAGYALRLGAKVRPISFVTPEGHGFEAAVGYAYQPAIDPGYWFETRNDTSWTGGIAGGDQERGPFHPGGSIQASSQLMVTTSYRSPRIDADLAVVRERSDSVLTGPIPIFNSTNLRLGVAYRLTPGFGAGFIYWGSGAAPWRDRVRIAIGNESDRTWAFVLRFGATPDKGVDVVVTSPTGSFSQSVSLLVLSR